MGTCQGNCNMERFYKFGIHLASGGRTRVTSLFKLYGRGGVENPHWKTRLRCFLSPKLLSIRLSCSDRGAGSKSGSWSWLRNREQNSTSKIFMDGCSFFFIAVNFRESGWECQFEWECQCANCIACGHVQLLFLSIRKIQQNAPNPINRV